MTRQFKHQVANQTRPSAADLNALGDLARRFDTQPLGDQMAGSQAPGGHGIGPTDDQLEVFKLAVAYNWRTDEGSYPAKSLGRLVFPVRILLSPGYDPSTPTTPLDSTIRGDLTFVYSLAGYIAEFSVFPVFRVHGQWYAAFNPSRRTGYWEILEGSLAHGSVATGDRQAQNLGGGLDATGDEDTVYCPLVPEGWRIPAGALCYCIVDEDSGLVNAIAANMCLEEIP